MKENNETENPRDEILIKKVEVDPINSDQSEDFLINIKDNEQNKN